MATSIEDLIKSSICFGVAFDPSVKECKICEVKLKCKSKCELGTGELPVKPEPTEVSEKTEVTYEEPVKPAKKPAKEPKTPKKDKPEVSYDGLPDLKAMSMEDIRSLAESRGISLSDFDKYGNDNIKRMRMTMAIKKTYEVK